MKKYITLFIFILFLSSCWINNDKLVIWKKDIEKVNTDIKVESDIEKIDIDNEKFSRANDFMNNLKITDCNILIDKKYSNLNKDVPKNFIEQFKKSKELELKQCKIWYTIKYKKNCNILNWDLISECEKIQKNVELYKKLKSDFDNYWNYNIEGLYTY